MITTYRVVESGGFHHLDGGFLAKTVLSTLLFLFGVSVFILVRFPDSLTDRTWIQVRGVIGGLLLMFALSGGMFL